MNNKLHDLIDTSWFLPLVFVFAISDLTIGLVIGLKIGSAQKTEIAK